MVPDSYKPKQKASSGVASDDPVIASIDRMLESLEERFRESNQIIDIRFQHVDALLLTQHDDIKAGYEQIVKSVEHIVKLHMVSLSEMVVHQDEKVKAVKECVDDVEMQTTKKFDAVHERISKHALRLEALEKKDDKRAADKWRAVADKVLWSFVGLLLAGAAIGVESILKELHK